MIDTNQFMRALHALGYGKVLSVPCSYLKYPINYAINERAYLPVCNEGDAAAISAGMTLAGVKSVVFLQNSGLSNAASPLSSLNYIFDLPCLLIMGYRGSGADEPQHELMGEKTEALLSDLKIENAILDADTDEAVRQLQKADAYIACHKRSYCLLVKPNAFERVELMNHASEAKGLLRFDVLSALASARGEDTIIITTTGFTSRELNTIDDHNNNFYMVGSMGCASAVGLGAALSNPEKKVVVVDGDGAFWMRPSILPVLAEQKPRNMLHVVLDNGAYESTGGQPPPRALSIQQMLLQVYGEKAHEFSTIAGFKSRLEAFLAQPAFTSLYGTVMAQSIPGLGRPAKTMREISSRFQEAIAK